MAASSVAWLKYQRALKNPAAIQQSILQQYIAANSETVFGRAHHFNTIKTYSDFARRVPIRSYDEFIPWIDRIRNGEPAVLTQANVRRLVATTGSTAARKLIPYTNESHQELNRAIGPWICDLFRQLPRTRSGSAYWTVTPMMPEKSDSEKSAVPIGFDDDASYLGGWYARAIAAMMAVPSAIKMIPDMQVLRYVTLLLLLRRSDLALISVWHPSFLELLLDALPKHFAALISDIADGHCSVIADVPTALHPLVLSRPNLRRARQLESTGPANIRMLWPMLSVVSCWADGNSVGAAASLEKRIPGIMIQPKGLLATEGVVSIPYRGQHPLAIGSHFFEFIDASNRIHLAHDLQIGETYDVVITTGGGLWRYRLNDLVQVDGNVGNTPSIRFIGKTAMISDHCGEKLSEGFVSQVLQKLFTKYPPLPSFTLLAPNTDANAIGYTLYANAHCALEMEIHLERLLCENPHYAYCVRLGQLRPVNISQVKSDAYQQYCQRLESLGQRLGDIKPSALSPLDGWALY